ncbi:MAG: hypothetical protein ACN0LA_11205 [Candidatus Longimicrobiales bacterium M2_2A_002]
MTGEARRARLVLPAAGSTEARVTVEPRPKATRTTRAAVILVMTLVLAPIAFLVPPHFLWPLVVLAVGAYFAYREWTGEYIVHGFEGACPRCGEPLEIEPGTRVRGRQRVECYGCHREPELVLEEATGDVAAPPRSPGPDAPEAS